MKEIMHDANELSAVVGSEYVDVAAGAESRPNAIIRLSRKFLVIKPVIAASQFLPRSPVLGARRRNHERRRRRYGTRRRGSSRRNAYRQCCSPLSERRDRKSRAR